MRPRGCARPGRAAPCDACRARRAGTWLAVPPPCLPPALRSHEDITTKHEKRAKLLSSALRLEEALSRAFEPQKRKELRVLGGRLKRPTKAAADASACTAVAWTETVRRHVEEKKRTTEASTAAPKGLKALQQLKAAEGIVRPTEDPSAVSKLATAVGSAVGRLGTAVSGVVSAASGIAAAALGADQPFESAPFQMLTLTVVRPPPLELAVREGALECVEELLGALAASDGGPGAYASERRLFAPLNRVFSRLMADRLRQRRAVAPSGAAERLRDERILAQLLAALPAAQLAEWMLHPAGRSHHDVRCCAKQFLGLKDGRLDGLCEVGTASDSLRLALGAAPADAAEEPTKRQLGFDLRRASAALGLPEGEPDMAQLCRRCLGGAPDATLEATVGASLAGFERLVHVLEELDPPPTPFLVSLLDDAASATVHELARGTPPLTLLLNALATAKLDAEHSAAEDERVRTPSGIVASSTIVPASGVTPLHLASALGATEVVQSLLRLRLGTADERTHFTRSSPLALACISARLSTVDVLCERVDRVPSPDALLASAELLELDVLLRLLHHRVPGTTSSRSGLSPLDVLARLGAKQVTRAADEWAGTAWRELPPSWGEWASPQWATWQRAFDELVARGCDPFAAERGQPAPCHVMLAHVPIAGWPRSLEAALRAKIARFVAQRSAPGSAGAGADADAAFFRAAGLHACALSPSADGLSLASGLLRAGACASSYLRGSRQTALHVLAAGGPYSAESEDCVRWLPRGRHPSADDGDAKLEFAALLLEDGTRRTAQSMWRLRDDAHNLPIHLAAAAGSLGLVKLLVESGSGFENQWRNRRRKTARGLAGAGSAIDAYLGRLVAEKVEKVRAGSARLQLSTTTSIDGLPDVRGTLSVRDLLAGLAAQPADDTSDLGASPAPARVRAARDSAARDSATDDATTAGGDASSAHEGTPRAPERTSLLTRTRSRLDCPFEQLPIPVATTKHVQQQLALLDPDRRCRALQLLHQIGEVRPPRAPAGALLPRRPHRPFACPDTSRRRRPAPPPPPHPHTHRLAPVRRGPSRASRSRCLRARGPRTCRCASAAPASRSWARSSSCGSVRPESPSTRRAPMRSPRGCGVSSSAPTASPTWPRTWAARGTSAQIVSSTRTRTRRAPRAFARTSTPWGRPRTTRPQRRSGSLGTRRRARASSRCRTSSSGTLAPPSSRTTCCAPTRTRRTTRKSRRRRRRCPPSRCRCSLMDASTESLGRPSRRRRSSSDAPALARPPSRSR